jgi:hypothetical protein
VRGVLSAATAWAGGCSPVVCWVVDRIPVLVEGDLVLYGYVAGCWYVVVAAIISNQLSMKTHMFHRTEWVSTGLKMYRIVNPTSRFELHSACGSEPL